MINIESAEHLQQTIERENGALAYFSGASCNVCKVLKPKITALCQERFPLLPLLYIDCEAHRDAAGQNQVFSLPTVVLFFGHREHTRLVRTFSMGALAEEIERPYQILFNE